MLNGKIFMFSIMEIILVILLLLIMINRKKINPFMLDFLIAFIGICIFVLLVLFIVIIIKNR